MDTVKLVLAASLTFLLVQSSQMQLVLEILTKCGMNSPKIDLQLFIISNTSVAKPWVVEL